MQPYALLNGLMPRFYAQKENWLYSITAASRAYDCHYKIHVYTHILARFISFNQLVYTYSWLHFSSRSPYTKRTSTTNGGLNISMHFANLHSSLGASLRINNIICRYNSIVKINKIYSVIYCVYLRGYTSVSFPSSIFSSRK